MRRTGASWRVLLRVFFFMVCPLAPGLLGAQTLRGFVTDAEEGTSLELVHVVLSSLQGGLKGTVTDLDGSYLLPSIEPGRYVLSASRIGYEVFTDSLEFTAADSRVLNIELSPGIALRELVVELERVRSSAGYVAARPRDIARIPMPDLTGDLAGYLAAMPGVVTVGDRGGQFFIRGGEPAQNLVQIDGVMVYQPMHILGFYSAFPSGIISRSDIYAGGFGTRFGERISSVIDVAARSGSTKHFAGSATLSPFISSAQLEGPLIPGRLSVLASLRRSLVKGGASRLISIGGRGRCYDNIMIERLWRSAGYEEVYLYEYTTLPKARQRLEAYFAFYIHQHPHQGLQYRIPYAVYAGLPETNKTMTSTTMPTHAHWDSLVPLLPMTRRP